MAAVPEPEAERGNKEENEESSVPLFVDSIRDAENLIESHELKTCNQFSIWKTKNFGKSDSQINIDNHKILFEDIASNKHTTRQIKYTGTPFIVVGTKIYDCRYGINRRLRKKGKKDSTKETGDIVFKQLRFHNQNNTKKQNCPAQIQLREVIFFPNYQAKQYTDRHKKDVVKMIREDWKNNSTTMEKEQRIYVRFPSEDSHIGHVVGEGSGKSLKLDKRVIEKITSLVSDGVCSVTEIEHHLKIFVNNELFRGTTYKPLTSNRRFYPKTKDIRNHMYLAIAKLSKIDQQNDDSVKMENIAYSRLPKRRRLQRSKADRCRELLKQITSLTYLVYDEDALSELENSLQAALNGLHNEIPQDDGQVLEGIKTERQTLLTKQYAANRLHTSRKRPFLKRVVESVVDAKKADIINILHEKSEKPGAVLEKIAPENEHIVALYDLSQWLNDGANDIQKINSEANDINVKSKNENHDSEFKDTNYVTNDEAKRNEPKINITALGEHNQAIPLRRNLKFSAEEKDTIMNNCMLTEESINICQNNLYEQFPEINGFFDTSIGKSRTFGIMETDHIYIQILHVGRLHWVCTANLNNKRENNAESWLFDSYNAGSVSLGAAMQIACFSNCNEGELNIHITSVQQQSDEVDCGPFAIAFATSLAYGENPCDIFYDEAQLRPHLVKCLENKKLTPFPRLPMSSNRLRCRGKTAKVQLFCSCRMPWNPNISDDSKGMVECTSCKQWFHKGCESIPDDIYYKARGNVWKCKDCKMDDV